MLRKFRGDDGIEWVARFKGTQVPSGGEAKKWVMCFRHADNPTDVWIEGSIIAEKANFDGLSEADLRKSLESATP